MFERFTDRARRVVVLAQEIARMAGSPEILTEHITRGIWAEGEGVGHKALFLAAVSVDPTFDGPPDPEAGVGAPSGHMPFNPEAKKLLEYSLREALQLGHNYIGTEHILLGTLRTEQGVKALELWGIKDPATVRTAVIDLLGSYDQSTSKAAPNVAIGPLLADELRKWIKAFETVHGNLDPGHPLSQLRRTLK